MLGNKTLELILTSHAILPKLFLDYNSILLFLLQLSTSNIRKQLCVFISNNELRT